MRHLEEIQGVNITTVGTELNEALFDAREQKEQHPTSLTIEHLSQTCKEIARLQFIYSLSLY